MDYNASTLIALEIVDAMESFLVDHYGNPFATHWAGKQVKVVVKTAYMVLNPVIFGLVLFQFHADVIKSKLYYMSCIDNAKAILISLKHFIKKEEGHALQIWFDRMK